MCGLWASVGVTADAARLDRIACRGPDGVRTVRFASPAGEVELGHRRLAIIDLSDDAAQPMADASGRFHAILNGEIYNFIELRDELAVLGHRFTTQSDTEVLLAGYKQWGEGVLDRLIGMFAALIWDDRDKTLFAFRDRFGVKPLYFAIGERGVAFGSEIKQLYDLPGVSRRANPDALSAFLSAGILDHSAATMFASVRQLRGGECVTLDLKAWCAADGVTPQRWYRAPVARERSTNASDELRALLSDSVRLHLRADVPVGSCLSGGLDSSAIVMHAASLLQAQNARRMQTVTAVYPGATIDEQRYAAAVAEAAHAQPHWVQPNAADFVDRLEEIAWRQDEPFGSTSILAQWSVFSAAREQGLKVMLDGQGADEILGGYTWMAGAAAADALRGFDIGGVATHLTAGGARRLAMGAVFAANDDGLGAAQRLKQGWRESALAPPASNADPVGDAARQLGLRAPYSLGDWCVLATNAISLPALLHWEDRSSMSHSIEARVPFLDHRLVEFALQLEDSTRLANGETKAPLRNATAGLVPDVVRQRRDKIGFATPQAAWMSGALAPVVGDFVEEALERFPDFFNATAVRAQTARTTQGAGDTSLVWRIASTGAWARVFGMSQ